MTDTLCTCAAQYSSHKPCAYLSICDVASEIEELNFLWYFILTDLHLHGHRWLEADILAAQV